MREEFINQPSFDGSLPFSIMLAGTSYCDGSYKIYREHSTIACFEYVISGCGTVKTNGKTFQAQQGDTYMLFPGNDHEYFSDVSDPWVKIWFNASGKMINALVELYRLENSTILHCNSLPYIEEIHKTLKDTALTPEEIADKNALTFHSLLQFLSTNKEDADIPSAEALQLKRYIDANLYSNITIEKLSGLIYKSPAQTIRIFKKFYGKTPYNYYMDNRIRTAISLLEGTGFSVKEIAYRLGFCDEHYFSGIFRKKTGKSPGEFRK